MAASYRCLKGPRYSNDSAFQKVFLPSSSRNKVCTFQREGNELGTLDFGHISLFLTRNWS